MAKNNKGFTLLELLVSLAIISVILLGFFRVLDSTSRMNTKNDRDIKALNLVQSEIENLRNQIKTLKEPKLNIDGKDIYIKNNEKVYDGKYQKKSGEKEYDVTLKINKRDISKDMYLFDLYISTQVNADDKYFSKKETKLTTSILSNNSLDTEEKPPVIEIPNYILPYAAHEALIVSNEGKFYRNLGKTVFNTRFTEAEYTQGSVKTIADKPGIRGNLPVTYNKNNYNTSGNVEKIKVEYKPNFEENGYIVMKISVQKTDGNWIESYADANQNNGNKYKYTQSEEVGIFIEGQRQFLWTTGSYYPGVILKNVFINGVSVGDITTNKTYSAKNAQQGVTIEFDGFEDNGKKPYDGDGTKVFFMFN